MFLYSELLIKLKLLLLLNFGDSIDSSFLKIRFRQFSIPENFTGLTPKDSI